MQGPMSTYLMSMFNGADLISTRHGGTIHHTAVRLRIGAHDHREEPLAGIRTRLKSGGGGQRRLGLSEAHSFLEPMPGNRAIAGGRALALSARGPHPKSLPSVHDWHLRHRVSVHNRRGRLQPLAPGRHFRRQLSVQGRRPKPLSLVHDPHLRHQLSPRGLHLRLQLPLVGTEDPARPERRACVVRRAAKALWEVMPLHHRQAGAAFLLVVAHAVEVDPDDCCSVVKQFLAATDMIWTVKGRTP